MFEKIRSFFSSHKKMNREALPLFEEILYESDVGVKTVQTILGQIKEHKYISFTDFRNIFLSIWLPKLSLLEKKIDITETPFVIFFVGVNGVGKTTTLAKMAYRLKTEGKKVLMVAADTFRAAAQEQLEIWSQKAEIPIVLKGEKKDPSSVIFEALEKAKKEKMNVVLIDTAGRLHTQEPLIEELKKMKRISQKVISTAPHEILLIVDANTGHTMLHQCRLFHEAMGVTGLIITKMDGTARGGGLLTLAEELSLPIVYVGTGEQMEDLKKFNAHDFLMTFIGE